MPTKTSNESVVARNQTRIAPARWLTASTRSVAKCRSASCPARNGPTIAPTAPDARITPHWSAENPRCPIKKGYNSGSHAPQMAYCKNIMSESFVRSPEERGGAAPAVEESVMVKV